MRKLFLFLAMGAMFAFIACGPNTESTTNETKDSTIIQVDSIADSTPVEPQIPLF